MTIHDFSFAAHADNFDAHIGSSIPGYDQLIEKCIGLSRRFVQSRTAVIDVGCSTGRLLTLIRRQNVKSRPGVIYRGIDVERKFSPHWRNVRGRDIRFEACDARSYRDFENISLASAIFTFQFIDPPYKAPVLRRIYNGLVTGGALIIAEKILATSSRFQDALTFTYYDCKLQSGFSAEQILDKERSLRGQMTLWTEDEMRATIRESGFRQVQLIWANFPFLAFVALK